MAAVVETGLTEAKFVVAAVEVHHHGVVAARRGVVRGVDGQREAVLRHLGGAVDLGLGQVAVLPAAGAGREGVHLDTQRGRAGCLEAQLANGGLGVWDAVEGVAELFDEAGEDARGGAHRHLLAVGERAGQTRGRGH